MKKNYRTLSDGSHRLILSRISKQTCFFCYVGMKLSHSELEDVVYATCPKCGGGRSVSCNLIPDPDKEVLDKK